MSLFASLKQGSKWLEILDASFDPVLAKGLEGFLKEERARATVFPAEQDVFRALELTPFEKVKVVILGQDPYHGAGQAQGLAFSVPAGFKLPPSLRNIYKELEADLAVDIAMDGDLSEWAQRGVLLLNTTLTVREKEPASHAARGWEELTDIIIKSLSDKAENIVFVLWGAHAHAKKSLVDSDRHLILEAPHPSPFSAHRGFFGSKPFSKTNKYLASVAKVPIDWTLTDRQGSLF